MKISIIIPVYNAEKYISKCLDSILKQTYHNLEVICVNDGSKDKSQQIIEKYIKKDKRIKAFFQKNKGIAETRNMGIRNATGEYIMFIDDDDYIEQKYIETYVKKTKNGKYDIVIGGYKRIDSNGKILVKQTLNKNSKWSKYVVTAPWAKIYKKSFIVENRIKFFNYMGEDIYFNLKCYSKNPKVKIIKNTGYIWFYNKDSVSNTLNNDNINIIILLDKIKKTTDINDKYIKYFFKRYVVWYLIYIRGKCDKKLLEKRYVELNEWLNQNNVNKTINPLSLQLRGEKIINRLAVLLFNITDRKTFIKIINSK